MSTQGRPGGRSLHPHTDPLRPRTASPRGTAEIQNHHNVIGPSHSLMLPGFLKMESFPTVAHLRVGFRWPQHAYTFPLLRNQIPRPKLFPLEMAPGSLRDLNLASAGPLISLHFSRLLPPFSSPVPNCSVTCSVAKTKEGILGQPERHCFSEGVPTALCEEKQHSTGQTEN